MASQPSISEVLTVTASLNRHVISRNGHSDSMIASVKLISVLPSAVYLVGTKASEMNKIRILDVELLRGS